MEQRLPELSIVIPAFNEEKFLPQALEGIHKATATIRRTFSVEIIVCDNASTDQTVQVARRYGARVVFEPKRQIARARNRGAAAARAPWLLFMDADCVPTKELLEELHAVLQDPAVVGGGALLSMPDGPWWARGITELWNQISRWTRWAPGSFLFCRRTVFHKLNGFNEQLYISEEIDFSRRLKAYARATRQRVVILRHGRLRISARKAYLYSVWEHLHFLLRCLCFPQRVRTDPSECRIWYEGRR